MKKIKTIGVLTSGGDAPGMNAAIRAVVRTSTYHECNVIGIQRGFTGLLQNLFVPLQNHSVAQKISVGGTFLKSSRCPEFKTKEARSQAFKNLQQQGIDALVVIGGDGS
ncbi:MAG TPA: 6-phosphofructokinase, partial [Bacteroidales bacterium]|nr:6-phosphofructokinase [Bacteroidales bacterium]